MTMDRCRLRLSGIPPPMAILLLAALDIQDRLANLVFYDYFELALCYPSVWTSLLFVPKKIHPNIA